ASESAEGIADEGELVVSAAELPYELVRSSVHFHDGVKISIRNDHAAVEIEIDRVRMIEIADERWRDIVAGVPVFAARDQRVDFTGRVDPQHLMNSDGVRRTATDLRAIECFEAVAEEVVGMAVSTLIEALK